ncbi:MAG: DUF2802 domain-containing protein [Candidatus Accumulibacter sp.]|nr:DUF2802 domain-containing protein [Accumulibacter sp.]
MLADLGWRDLVIAICALLAIYVVFVFFQISRLKQEKKTFTSFDPPPRPTVDAYETIMKPDRASGSPVLAAPSKPAREDRDEKARQFSSVRVSTCARDGAETRGRDDTSSMRDYPSEGRGPPEEVFDGQRERVLHDGMATESFQSRVENRKKMIALEQDLDQLRKEVGRLRAEILLLREACQKPDKLSPSSPQVSSFYSDAMQMAAQGESMENISQLCGISRAEAELVKALVKDRAK